jgi:hypothetical protein
MIFNTYLEYTISLIHLTNQLLLEIGIYHKYFLSQISYFFFTCSPSRDFIDLPDYKDSSPEGLSVLNMLPPFPTKFSHLLGVIF